MAIFDTVPFQDSVLPPPPPVPGAGVGAGESQFDDADFSIDTALEREITGTTEIQLRTWIDIYGPEGVSSEVRNQFVDRWLLREPDTTVDALTRDNRFITGLSHLPYFDALPPPAFVTPDGQGFTWDISSGFRPLPTDEFQLVAGQTGLPTFDLGSAVQQIRVRRSGGGSGGGGGGGGRAQRVFDTAQLTEAASNMWRGLLLELDDEGIKSVVQDYKKQANAFWLTEGGSLDFETFVRDRIRSTERHKMLYSRKPQEITEEQYLGQFTQAVSQFPQLRPDQQTRELERSVTSGGSAAGQAQRIANTTDVLRADSNFATRFAQTLAGLGKAAQG